MRLGGGHHKDDMGRRFFQGLQEGIEGRLREHMDFIDDVNLVFVLRGKISDILPEFPDLIDPAVGGSIDFEDIDGDPIPDLLAERALIAGVPRRSLGTIEGFGQDPGDRGFPHPRGPEKR